MVTNCNVLHICIVFETMYCSLDFVRSRRDCYIIYLPFVFSFSKSKEETVRSTCEYFYAQLFNALEWEKELVYRRQQEVCNQMAV